MEERGTVAMSSFIVKVGGPLVIAPGAVVMVAGVLLEVGWSVASVEVMDLVRLMLLAVVIVLVGGDLVEVFMVVVVGALVEVVMVVVGGALVEVVKVVVGGAPVEVVKVVEDGALVVVVKVVVGMTVEICKPLVGLVVVDSVVGLPAETI